MRYVYFDASSGLSGDMILGALLDLGPDADAFQDRMAGLGLRARISARRVRRGGLRALKVDVDVEEGRRAERTLADIERIIKKARLSSGVKGTALRVFRRLFEAEAKVHGRRLGEAHLHEAGADDAIIDIVGAAVLLEELGVERVLCSPLNVGSGWVRTSHGRLPVPPPAVAELLRGIPVYSAWAEAELVTPTGAAIVSTLAERFTRLPELVYEKVGCGAGSRELPEIPNILRAYAGPVGSAGGNDAVFIVEAAIDDASPQLLAHFLDTALEKGALDATLTPTVMKKGRLGTLLTLLVPADRMDALIEAVFEETTTLGVRYHPVGRRVLERRTERVRVGRRTVRIKIGSLAGRGVNVQPEYEDVLEAARTLRRPAKEVARQALVEHGRKRG